MSFSYHCTVWQEDSTGGKALTHSGNQFEEIPCPLLLIKTVPIDPVVTSCHSAGWSVPKPLGSLQCYSTGPALFLPTTPPGISQSPTHFSDTSFSLRAVSFALTLGDSYLCSLLHAGGKVISPNLPHFSLLGLP